MKKDVVDGWVYSNKGNGRWGYIYYVQLKAVAIDMEKRAKLFCSAKRFCFSTIDFWTGYSALYIRFRY